MLNNKHTMKNLEDFLKEFPPELEEKVIEEEAGMEEEEEVIKINEENENIHIS
jgi:hypothetical protein